MTENSNTQDKPLSFTELVARCLKDPDFADRLRRLAGKASTDEAALAELRQVFALTPAELNKLHFSPEDEARLDEFCTVPTRTTLVGFVNFLPAGKK